MGAQLGSDGAVSDLNLTPLIDIVLVVLIIMMVNMPIEIEEMGVKLPALNKPPRPPQDAPAEQLVVAIYASEAEGRPEALALNRKRMTEEVLFFEVTRRLRPLTEKSVFIDAAPTVSYGRVVDMMDLAREAGAAKVGLARMKEAGPLAPTSVAPGAMPRDVMIGSPSVVGAITEKAADKALKPYKRALENCYYPLLAQSPDMTGRMMLRFAVGPEGEHMGEKISSNTVEPIVEGMEECVMALMPSVVFEPLGEGKTAIVQYPVLFSPG